MPQPKKDHIPGRRRGSLPAGKVLHPWTKEFWEELKKLPTTPTKENPGIQMTPDVLWALACEYFQQGVEDNMNKVDFIRSGDAAGQVIYLPTQRPYSWTSFELFLTYKGVRRSIKEFRANRDGRYAEYAEVVERIDSVIYQQKFDGAAIGGYNPQLIIRDLGLAEKVDAKLQQEQPLFIDTPQPPVEE